jgi:hypothetical protein
LEKAAAALPELSIFVFKFPDVLLIMEFNVPVAEPNTAASTYPSGLEVKG